MFPFRGQDRQLSVKCKSHRCARILTASNVVALGGKADEVPLVGMAEERPSAGLLRDVPQFQLTVCRSACVCVRDKNKHFKKVD